MIDVKNSPPLKAILTYQRSEDEQEVYCRMQFETPYKVVTAYPVNVERYGDKVICCFTVQDGKFITLRIDHPESAIHGCTTRYERKERAIPFFFEPTFNMDIEVKEGFVHPVIPNMGKEESASTKEEWISIDYQGTTHLVRDPDLVGMIIKSVVTKANQEVIKR